MLLIQRSLKKQKVIIIYTVFVLGHVFFYLRILLCLTFSPFEKFSLHLQESP